MKAKEHLWEHARLPLAVCLSALVSGQASAVSFSLGEIDGQFDSTLSVGASWALRNPDKQFLNDHAIDDGRRNFKKGETFSKVFKGIHDLELKYGDSGVLVRGKYWYDFELKDEGRLFKDIDDHNRKEAAQSSGAQILDAFLYHNYSIDDLAGTVRLGKQVVSWGESTFIQGGINSINPIDVTAFRRPGAEIKEGLIPVNMFYMSQGISDQLTLEAFYQLEWDQTVIDNCGTFFSQADMAADGCNNNFAVPTAFDQDAATQAALASLGVNFSPEGVLIPRAGDRDARDDGQWGAALRWFAPQLDAEFAAYFMNYHSRAPYVNSISSDHVVDLGAAPAVCSGLGVDIASCIQAFLLGTSQYFMSYPEDIRLYGLTFSTTLATGTSLSGEISYRPNMPLALNGNDIFNTAVGAAPFTPLLSTGAVQTANGAEVAGYRRKEVTQAQVTAAQFFDQVLGADRVTVLGEVGVTYIGGLEGKGGLRYGRSTGFGQGALYPDNSLCTGITNTASPQDCNNDGFATRSSWGYRLRVIGDYNGVIPGVELHPNLAWSHDVDGYGPEPGFNEGSKAVSVGIDANYLNTYNASLSYTDFFGGKYNSNIDRDFVALSFGVSF